VSDANRTDEQHVDFAALHEAQAALCREKGWPHFAPRVCWKCRKEIYSHPNAQSAAGMTLITGCPHCHWSYCE
jgi:hypothetical protein